MFYDFFFNFSENLGFEKLPNLVFVYCESTLWSFNVQILLPTATAEMLLVFKI